MGSAMRPRPWYVSTPFMAGRSVAGDAEEAIAVDGAHGDRLEAAIALDHHLHLLLDAALPELPVELLLGVDLLAVEPRDHVAGAKAGGARGPDGRHAGDDDAPALEPLRVQAEPWTRTTARDAPFGEELVPAGQEVLDGNRQIRVRRLAEAERGHADYRARRVHERRAPERGIVGRHHEGAVEHVLPRRRERPHRLHPARGGHQVALVGDAHRAGDVARAHRAGVAERGGGPRPAPLEARDRDADLEVEPDQPRG